MQKEYQTPEYEVITFSKNDYFMTNSECDCFDPSDVVCDNCTDD